MVNSVLEHLQSEIEEKKARVESSRTQVNVLAYEPILGQVLTNLVSNALKFVAPTWHRIFASGPR
jgi:signal transduction histidine kinase